MTLTKGAGVTLLVAISFGCTPLPSAPRLVDASDAPPTQDQVDVVVEDRAVVDTGPVDAALDVSADDVVVTPTDVEDAMDVTPTDVEDAMDVTTVDATTVDVPPSDASSVDAGADVQLDANVDVLADARADAPVDVLADVPPRPDGGLSVSGGFVAGGVGSAGARLTGGFIWQGALRSLRLEPWVH